MEKVYKYGLVVSTEGNTAYICIQDNPDCAGNCEKKHSCGIMKDGFIEKNREDISIIEQYDFEP